MPYALSCQNYGAAFLDSRVHVSGVAGSRDWKWLIDIRLDSSNFPSLSYISGSSELVFFTSPTTLELRNGGTTVFDLNTSAQSRTTIEIVGLNGIIYIYQDGVIVGSTSSESDNFFGPDRIASFNNDTRLATIFNLEFYENGALVHDYLNESGAGSTWPDVVGSNDITLGAGYPTDGSQWEFYDDGSSTAPTLTPKVTGITATSAVPVIDVTF